MLTAEERTQVKGWLLEYPKGIEADAWGYGPLQRPAPPMLGDKEDWDILMKYG